MFYNTSQINSILICGACGNKYEDPRVLPCGNSICFMCFFGQTNKTGKFICQNCNQYHKIDVDLPPNKSIIEMLKQKPEHPLENLKVVVNRFKEILCASLSENLYVCNIEQNKERTNQTILENNSNLLSSSIPIYKCKDISSSISIIEFEPITDNETNRFKCEILPQIENSWLCGSRLYAIFENKSSEIEAALNKIPKMPLKLSCRTPITLFTFYNYFKSSLNLNTNLHPIQTTGDGNCLYNAFSILLFENENKWHIIKSCMLYQMFKHKEFFQEIMNSLHYNENVDIAIQRAARSREYGNEINILALAILFQRDIIVYIASTKTNQINQVIYSLNIKNKNENPCLLGLVNEHFFPILVEKTLIPQQERIINKNYFLAGREIILEKYFHKF
jgi:phage anti-repressor protein